MTFLKFITHYLKNKNRTTNHKDIGEVTMDDASYGIFMKCYKLIWEIKKS